MTSTPGEFDLIAKYFAPLAAKGAFGFRDDAACFEPSHGKELVITQDAIAEDVHFHGDDPPDSIAAKALRVNLSDLAAKGATPKWASLALGLGAGWSEAWVAGFARGLAQDLETYGLSLTGGDTFSAGARTVISVTLIGEVPAGTYTSRLGGNAGDRLYVTGTIGDAALGLAVINGMLPELSEDDRSGLVDRYQRPDPRVEAIGLVREFATAAMDISDGLISDTQKLASSSNVSAILKADDIPLSAAAKAACGMGAEWFQWAVAGGDDYEILMAVAPKNEAALVDRAGALDLPLSKIGELTDGETMGEVCLIDKAGNKMQIAAEGFDHFSADGKPLKGTQRT